MKRELSGRYPALLRDYIYRKSQEMLHPAEGPLKHPFLTPGSASYCNTLWDWDSWLMDVALRQVLLDCPEMDDSQIAAGEEGCILNFLESCTPEGYIPIFIHTFEDADMTGGLDTNMHKPNLAQHAAFVTRCTGSAEFIRPHMETIVRFVERYFREFRHACGLFFWKDDFAIGVDNDPSTFYRPKNSSGSIYLNALMYREMLAVAYLYEKLGDGAQAVCWHNRADELRAAIQKYCWDERDGCFYSVDFNLLPIDPTQKLHSGRPRHWDCLIMRLGVWSSFLSMWAGIATPEQAERMVREHITNPKTFWAAYGVRTMSKLEAMYLLDASGNPSNWLGPVWGISNYMVFRGLVRYGYEEEAALLVEKTVELFGRDLELNGCFHEYYDPDLGEPIINPGFQNWNWLVLNMMAWYEGRPQAIEI